MISYTLIRSDRKTIALQVKQDGTVIVRAPRRAASSQIDSFVNAHQGWIADKLTRLEEAQSSRLSYTEEERRRGILTAREVLPQRAAYFAARMGVSYNRITIREQKTRWGSCSSRGNLSFNWKLVLLPGDLLDYVVVHELAHRREMNHSPRFWAVVEQELPDYQQRRRRLKAVLL